MVGGASRAKNAKDVKVLIRKSQNSVILSKVRSHDTKNDATSLGLGENWKRLPGVAHGAQPRAVGHNLVGINWGGAAAPALPAPDNWVPDADHRLVSIIDRHAGV
jgi:hypothetical protein